MLSMLFSRVLPPCQQSRAGRRWPNSECGNQQLFAGLLVRRWTSAELLSLDQELLRQELLGPVDDAAERQLREGSVEWQQQRRMDEEER